MRSRPKRARATTSNSDIVRRLFDLWSEGRLDDIRASVAEDIEWLEPPEAPDRHIVTGRDAALQAMTNWIATWSEYEASLCDVIEYDDQALAVLRQRVGTEGGPSVAGDLFMLWTIRDGVPVRMEMYLDRASADAAARSVIGNQ